MCCPYLAEMEANTCPRCGHEMRMGNAPLCDEDADCVVGEKHCDNCCQSPQFNRFAHLAKRCPKDQIRLAH